MRKRKRKRKNHKKKYQQTERVKEGKKKRIRVRVRDKMKTLEERKTEKHKFIRNMYIEEIHIYKNEEIKKMKKFIRN